MQGLDYKHISEEEGNGKSPYDSQQNNTAVYSGDYIFFNSSIDHYRWMFWISEFVVVIHLLSLCASLTLQV